MRRLRQEQDGPREAEGPGRGYRKLCSHSLSSACGCTCKSWGHPWLEPAVLQVQRTAACSCHSRVPSVKVSSEGSGQADPRRSSRPPLCGFSQWTWVRSIS